MRVLRAQVLLTIHARVRALNSYPSHTHACARSRLTHHIRLCSIRTHRIWCVALATHHMRLHLRAVSARLLSTTYARMRALKHPPQTFSDVMSQAELASKSIHPLISGSLH